MKGEGGVTWRKEGDQTEGHQEHQEGQQARGWITAKCNDTCV